MEKPQSITENSVVLTFTKVRIGKEYELLESGRPSSNFTLSPSSTMELKISTENEVKDGVQSSLNIGLINLKIEVNIPKKPSDKSWEEYMFEYVPKIGRYKQLSNHQLDSREVSKDSRMLLICDGNHKEIKITIYNPYKE